MERVCESCRRDIADDRETVLVLCAACANEKCPRWCRISANEFITEDQRSIAPTEPDLDDSHSQGVGLAITEPPEVIAAASSSSSSPQTPHVFGPTKEEDKLGHWRAQLLNFDVTHGADLPSTRQAILFLRRGYYYNKMRAFEMRLNAPPTRRKHAGDREMRRAQKYFALWASLEGLSNPEDDLCKFND